MLSRMSPHQKVHRSRPWTKSTRGSSRDDSRRPARARSRPDGPVCEPFLCATHSHQLWHALRPWTRGCHRPPVCDIPELASIDLSSGTYDVRGLRCGPRTFFPAVGRIRGGALILFAVVQQVLWSSTPNLALERLQMHRRKRRPSPASTRRRTGVSRCCWRNSATGSKTTCRSLSPWLAWKRGTTRAARSRRCLRGYRIASPPSGASTPS